MACLQAEELALGLRYLTDLPSYQTERIGPHAIRSVWKGEPLVNDRLLNRARPALERAASRHAEQLVRGGRVELELDPANAASDHRDRYGRTLAYVWVVKNGRRVLQVNRTLAADGYAYAYTQYPFRYMKEFRALQGEAGTRRRGLHGGRTDRRGAGQRAFGTRGADQRG